MEHLIVTGLTMAGKELLSKILVDTYELVKESNKHPRVQTLLNQLDMEADLQVIDALVKEVTAREEEEGIADAVDVALANVAGMVQKIKKELEIIQKETDFHITRWFSGWRTPNFNHNLDNLVKHKILLDKRVDFMIKLLNLKRYHHRSHSRK